VQRVKGGVAVLFGRIRSKALTSATEIPRGEFVDPLFKAANSGICVVATE
jgi:hypothetical protein